MAQGEPVLIYLESKSTRASSIRVNCNQQVPRLPHNMAMLSLLLLSLRLESQDFRAVLMAKLDLKSMSLPSVWLRHHQVRPHQFWMGSERKLLVVGWRLITLGWTKILLPMVLNRHWGGRFGRSIILMAIAINWQMPWLVRSGKYYQNFSRVLLQVNQERGLSSIPTCIERQMPSGFPIIAWLRTKRVLATLPVSAPIPKPHLEPVTKRFG